MTTELLYDGTDIIDDVILSTARFTSQVNSIGGPCILRVKDNDRTRAFTTGKSLELIIDGRAMWTGYATKVLRVYPFEAFSPPAREIEIEGIDINYLFEKRVVYKKSSPAVLLGPIYPANTDDTTAIAELVANWLDLSGDGLDTSTLVNNVGTINETEKANPWSASWKWGQAMQSIARLPAAIYYINPDRQLVYCDVDTPTVTIALSDQPMGPGSGTVETDDFNRTEASDWGSAPYGTWTGFQGDPSVDGSKGVIDSAGGYRVAATAPISTITETSIEQTGMFQWPSAFPGVARWLPAWATYPSYDNYVFMTINGDQDPVTVELEYDMLIGSDNSATIDTIYPAATPGSWWHWRFAWDNLELRAKAWPDGEAEPDWQVTLAIPVDPTALTDPAVDLFGSTFPDTGQTWYVDDITLTRGIVEDSLGYRELTFVNDGGQLANDVMIWGISGGATVPVFKRLESTASQTAHGRWQYGEVRADAYKQTTINRIANSYLNGSPQSKRGHKDDRRRIQVAWFEPLLRPSDKVRFISSVYGIDEVFPVRSSTITFPAGPTDPKFELILSHEIDLPIYLSDVIRIPPYQIPGFPPIPPFNPEVPHVGPGTCDDSVCVQDTEVYDNFNRTTSPIGGGVSDPTHGWGTPSSGAAYWFLDSSTAQTYCDGSRAVIPYVMASFEDSVAAVSDGTIVPGPWEGSFETEVTFEYDTAVPGIGNYDFTRITLNAEGTSINNRQTCTLYIGNEPDDLPFLRVQNALTTSDLLTISTPPINTPIHLKWEYKHGVSQKAKVWWSGPEPDWMVELTETFAIIGQRRFFSVFTEGSYDHTAYIDDLIVTPNRCGFVQFDDFNRTVAANGWGTATGGGTWTSLAGSAAYSVNGSAGQMVLPNVLGSRTLGWNVSDGILDTPWWQDGLVPGPRAHTTRTQFRLTSIPTAGFIQMDVKPGEIGPIVRMFSADMWLSRHDGSGTIMSAGPPIANRWYILETVYAAGTYTARVIEQDGTLKVGDVTWSDDPQSTIATVGGLNSGSAVTRTLQIDYIDFSYVGRPCYAGGPSGGAVFTDRCEVLETDGVTDDFTLSQGYTAGSLYITNNGLFEQPDVHYTETSPDAGTFHMNFVPEATDVLRVCFTPGSYSGGAGGGF